MIVSFVESLRHLGWTSERFGVTPGKLKNRMSGASAPKVFCVSIPKAGTHLLERALCLHPALYRKLLPTVSEENIGRWNGLEGLLPRVRPGQVVASHLRFKDAYPTILDAARVPTIFLIRDPHDIVISEAHYISKRTDHRGHELFAGLPDMKARLRVAITGDADHKLASIGERLDFFSGWLDNSLVVRFEDLIGPGGGGSAQTQSAAVASIYDHLGMPLDPELRDSICARLFSSDSPTFRQGAAKGWEREFDAELVGLFDEVVGDRSRRYGY
jgi:sulfotransferase family protein